MEPGGDKSPSSDLESPVQGSRGACNDADDELDALLDDTLQDFEEYSTKKTPKKDKEEGCNDNKTKSGAKLKTTNAEVEEASVNPEFGASDYDEKLKSLLEGDAVLKEEFEKLSQAAAQADGMEGGLPNDFAETLAQTLNSLSQNAESLQGDMTDDDLMKAFEQSLNLGGEFGGEPGEDGDFIPMMQNMMSNLLSKDILYPSLKDLSDKYPGWIRSNEEKIPKQQFDTYCKQYNIVTKLCEEYESEKSTDSQQTKDERFERILDLMTKMQDCGAPPKEIVNDLAPGLEFDGEGNPQLPGMPNMDQCSVM